MPNTKLVIFGAEDTAELAHYYFTRDTDYEVVAFTLNEEFCKRSEFLGLPLVPFESLLLRYPPGEYSLFIALGYSKINKLRMDKFLEGKSLGYEFASYISPRATILNEQVIGDNCFILENNTVQPFVTIGDNVTLWSGNHIGHHSEIGDHAFLASHIVVSGRVKIGAQCFIGVNATLRDHIDIGKKSIVGAGVLVLRSCEPESLFKGKATPKSQLSSSLVKQI